MGGATRRIWRRLHPRTLATHGWRRTAWWTLLVTLLVLAWVLVLTWYVAWYGLGAGWLLFVFRIVRRTQRRGHRNALRHRELLMRLGVVLVALVALVGSGIFCAPGAHAGQRHLPGRPASRQHPGAANS